MDTPNLLGRVVLAAAVAITVSLDARADGTLTHLSGTVSILKSDGKTQPGAVGGKAYTGDTVVTGAGGYARLEMTDGGEIVLRPDSQLKIDSYHFAEGKATDDSFVFSMLKGGLRTVTGLIGKRGNRDAYKLKTDTATIGIRGTQFDLRVCAGNCGALADGTYIAVKFGAIQASNPQGNLPVAAGQVAVVPQARPPVILPRDPGIGFTPPAVIPKLDEKKKVQAQQAALPGDQKPTVSTTSGQNSVKSAPQDDSKTEGAKSDSGTKEESAPKNDTSSTSKETSGNSGTKSAGNTTSGRTGSQNTASGNSQASGTSVATTAPPAVNSPAPVTSTPIATANPLAAPSSSPAGVTCSVE